VTAVLVCTHGNSAAALVASAEMICGRQKNLATVAYEMGESPEDLRQEIKNVIAPLDMEEGLLCLTDLKGGTPFNTLLMLMATHNHVEIVAGVNVPMLVETFLSRERLDLNDLTEAVVTTGMKSIYRYTPEDDQDETF
jgi:mannose/fructose/sorbose-specific phosphotransferase system IIA component